MPYNIMKPADLFDRMKARSRPGKGERPSFTIILGSGFSYPIIPTTTQIVREDLPWWKWCHSGADGAPPRNDYQDRLDGAQSAEAKAEAKAFWQRVTAAQAAQPADPDRKPFALDPADGLPTRETVGEAYRFTLSAECGPGLDSPHDVRRYFGDIIRRVGRRLNPAHLFLAAVVAERRRLFGTIFTTNFDPLLQRALQLVNVPYFVSDRPDTMQHPDDDDVADALHLVYAHGSIYRYLLLNSPAEIEAYANRNQPLLQDYFRKHAVLIVGYSGWDDAITRALKSVDRFAHNLYWCDRGTSPEAGGLSADARSILQSHRNAFFVPITGADALMAQMHQHLLDQTLPRFFHSPILAAKEQLELCDLTGVKLPRSVDPSRAASAPSDDGKDVGSAAGAAGSADELDLGDEVERIIKRLDEAQRFFTGESTGNTQAALTARVRERMTTASDLYFGGKYAEALPHLEFVVANAHVLDVTERALAHFRRGVAYGRRGGPGDADRATADYTAVIDMPDAPAEVRARALVSRGAAYDQRGGAGDVELAIADYTAVIGTPDASAEVRAKALVNRGITYVQRGGAGNADLAIADYTAVIDMPDAPDDQREKAQAGIALLRPKQRLDGESSRVTAGDKKEGRKPNGAGKRRAGKRSSTRKRGRSAGRERGHR